MGTPEVQAGIAAANLAVTVVTGYLKHPLILMKARLTGQKLLLLGPSEAGKTRFWNYLTKGHLSPNLPHRTTVDITNSGAARVKLGENDHLDICAFDDSPGQVTPSNQVQTAIRENPDEVIIVIDGTGKKTKILDKEVTQEQWIESFFEDFGFHYRNPKKLKNLKNITIILNKLDMGSIAEFDIKKSTIAEILLSKLSGALPKDTISNIPILYTVLVRDTPYGESKAYSTLEAIIFNNNNSGGRSLRVRT